MQPPINSMRTQELHVIEGAVAADVVVALSPLIVDIEVERSVIEIR